MTIQAKAVKNLFEKGKIDETGLSKAVTLGIITEEEYKEIINKEG